MIRRSNSCRNSSRDNKNYYPQQQQQQQFNKASFDTRKAQTQEYPKSLLDEIKNKRQRHLTTFITNINGQHANKNEEWCVRNLNGAAPNRLVEEFSYSKKK